MDGILIINKEKGYTSRDVVNLVGKYLHTKKVGHTGTLDPMAEGVLIVAVGKATKLVEVLTEDEKEYVAEITLGIDSDTLDKEGMILKKEEAIRSREEIIKVLEMMKGTYEQEVPIYSAVKKKGKRLYEYARNKEEVELPKREVTIKEIELIGDVQKKNGHTIFSIRTVVSKGTYIRSLVRDIALNLNTIGIMTKLTRTRVGGFKLENSVSLNSLKEGRYTMLPLEETLGDYPVIVASSELVKKIRNGSILDIEKKKPPLLFVDQNGSLLALYQVYSKDPTKMKPWKTFF